MRKEPYGLMPIFAHRCMHHEIYGKRLQYETYKSSQILHSINDTIDHFGMVVDGVLKAEQYTSQEVCCAVPILRIMMCFLSCCILQESGSIRIRWSQ